MRGFLVRLLTMVSFMGVLAAPVAAASAPTPTTLKASDGVIIHGLYYQSPHPRALILLFHQAGSSKAEYASIAPKLVEAGYSALAIDQRSGGDLFGPNETANGLGRKTTYLEAKKDLEAALAWAGQQRLPVAIWGSSYSSSLVFLVAAEHPETVKAVLAFSPGEYFDQPSLVRDAAAKVKAPIFVTSANTSEEIDAARGILAASPAAIKVQYVPTAGGIHGSSTLIPAKNKAGAAANWDAVLAFLTKAL